MRKSSTFIKPAGESDPFQEHERSSRGAKFTKLCYRNVLKAVPNQQDAHMLGSVRARRRDHELLGSNQVMQFSKQS